MPRISIVVPVYKVEKYLRRCIDSILAQTFQDFEVLLIDDGSPDKSGQICDEYMKKDKRIHVFHKKNEGVTSARKVGLENSIGEYIMFVDSDDTIPLDAIMILYEKLKSNRLDIALGGWNKVSRKCKRIIPMTINGIFSANDYVKYLLLEKCYVGPVGKLIKRDLFDENTLDISSEIIINEDLIMNLRLASCAEKIGIYPSDIVYNYHQNENSASTRKLTNNQCEKLFSAVEDSLDKEFHEYFLKYIIKFFYRYKYLNYKQNQFYKLLKKNKFACSDKFYYYRNYLISPHRIIWKLAVIFLEINNKIRKLYLLIKYRKRYKFLWHI